MDQNPRLGKVFAALLALVAVPMLMAPPVLADDDPWPDIQKSVFQGRVIEDAASALELYAPGQAEDAAVVPVSIKIAPALVGKLGSLTLVIDRNPAPVAATFAFTDAFRATADTADRIIATRVRLDAFSRVRAVGETTDGSLLMVSKFVIGAGGCSAPAAKDADKSLAELGRTQVKLRDDDNRPSWREAQIMIKHPNYTGMQMDPVSRGYTPARFVNTIEVKSGNDVLFRMEGGISISENPNIRFTYTTPSPADLEFTAEDTDGTKFKGSSKGNPS